MCVSRHVILPKEMVKLVPTTHLMSEAEWRGIGVQQSQGWEHYMIHKPGQHLYLYHLHIFTVTLPLYFIGQKHFR